MKIAHVTSGLDRKAAGVGAAVAGLSAAQLEVGHDVKVFGLSSNAWKSGDWDLWRGAPAQAYDIRLPPRAFGFAPDLAAALLSFDPNIVHLHGLWMYPGLAVLRWHRETDLPYVCSVHGMLAPVALDFSRWKKRLVRALFQDQSLAEATILHATTAVEVQEIRDFGLNNPVATVPLGIHPTAVPEVQAARSPRRVLSLGRVHPKKGLDHLVKAWAKLEAEFPGWQLDIVGPEEAKYGAELRQLVKKLALKRLSILPPVYGADRNHCMASAEVFVLPTRNENFALTVAESLMMQTPVIVTKRAPWSGLKTERCGWWIDHGVEPLVQALRSAMSLSDKDRSEMGHRGREWMLRDYSWSVAAREMLTVYREAIAVY